MINQVVGYIRVSSEGQNTARQLSNIKLDKEFVDIMTGSTKERENLNACLEYVREGDTLVVDSIDRLARNLRDLQEIIHSVVDKGVSVRFLKENLVFTSNQDPIANLTLQIMGSFAEFERTMIKARQREGITAAKKAGKYLGRPIKATKKVSDIAKELKNNGENISQIALKLNLSRPSIYKILKFP